VLFQIARTQAEAGALDQARQTARAITRGSWQDFAWRAIAVAEAKSGQAAAALTTIDHLHDGYDKDEALKEVTASFVRAKDLDKAAEVMKRIKDQPTRLNALLEIGKGRARAGQRREADVTFQQVFREAEQLKDSPHVGNVKPAMLSHLAEAQADVGEERDAQAWIDRSSSPQVKAWALIGLAEAIVRRQEPVKPQPSYVKATGSFKGKILLFGSARYADTESSAIMAIEPAGRGIATLLELKDGGHIMTGRISPDGRRLAFSVRRGHGEEEELWLLETNGRRRKLADRATAQAWSADSRRLACFRSPNHQWQSFTVDSDTGQEQQLAISPSDMVMDWSPDGRQLAVMAGNDRHVFNHPTNGTYPLRQLYLLNPDSTGRIDFAMVASRDGKQAKEVLDFNAFFQGNKSFKPNAAPCWSPDGKSVVWLVLRNRTQAADLKCELVFVPVETGSPRRLRLDQLGIQWVQTIDWR
jgi:hypothetical protein